MRVEKNEIVIYEYSWICPHCAAACEGYAGGQDIEVLKCDACGTEIAPADAAEEWEEKERTGRR